MQMYANTHHEQASVIGVIQRVTAAIPSLTEAEQRVGRLLISDAEKFLTSSASDLALQAGVSKPTVVRFCRSIGYKGLVDIRSQLSTNSFEGVPLIHPCVQLGDKAEEILVKVIDNCLAAIGNHRQQNCVATYEKATKAIVDGAEMGCRIEFFGVGTSGVVAQDAQRKFSRLGIHTNCQIDTIFQTMNATMLKPNDCMIAISNSGRSQEILNIARVAKISGATVIAITASGSPLARLASYHLVADHNERFEFYEPMVSRMIHLLVIDVLVTCVAMSMGYKRLEPILKSAKHVLRNKIYT